MLITRDLTIRINNQFICQQLNLTIHAGEIWGILGINGSGKTTLLHTLAGLLPAKKGEIWLDSNPLSSLPPKTIAQSIGMLFQDITLPFTQTVREYCEASRYPHLAYFHTLKKKDHNIVTQALQKTEMQHLAQRQIQYLSGGEKRRLALATILAQTPRFYLLDEPTNHLDIRHQMHILDYFRRLATTTAISIIMALHDVNLAQQFCTHALLLFQNGETLQGTVRNMLTPAYLSRLYQFPLHAIQQQNNLYWQPQFEIT